MNNLTIGAKNLIQTAKEFEEAVAELENKLQVLNIISDKRVKRIKKLAIKYSKISPLSAKDIIAELFNHLSYPEGLDFFNDRVKELEKKVGEAK